MIQINLKASVLLGLLLIAAVQFAEAGTSLGTGCGIAGPTNAEVTIEEFVDFECKYCERGANIMKEALKDFPGRIRLILRNIPLAAHKNSEKAARAFTAVCLQNPSLAFTYQDELFAHRDELLRGESFLYELADKLGVNVEKMKADMNSEAVSKVLIDDQMTADVYGFKGTPSFIIGREPIVGALPYEEIKRVIDRQLRHH